MPFSLTGGGGCFFCFFRGIQRTKSEARKENNILIVVVSFFSVVLRQLIGYGG
jgi:hypothetical protein